LNEGYQDLKGTTIKQKKLGEVHIPLLGNGFPGWVTDAGLRKTFKRKNPSK